MIIHHSLPYVIPKQYLLQVGIVITPKRRLFEYSWGRICYVLQGRVWVGEGGITRQQLYLGAVRQQRRGSGWSHGGLRCYGSGCVSDRRG